MTESIDMKYIVILILSFFMFYIASSQTVSSSCVASEAIYLKYKKSADKLTVNRCLKIGNTYKDSITIDKQLSNQYLKTLFAVYNATSLSARDTVVNLINVVKDYVCPPDLNSIYIKADSTKLWVQNIRNNIAPSGNPQIDYLIQKYSLRKTAYFHTFNTSLYHIINFETDSNCHINRLCDKFNALFMQGVNGSGPNNLNKSEGLNIVDSVNINFTELTYSYSWGDCTLGCTYSRYWKFKVFTNCSVEYKGSGGDPLPEGIFASLKNLTTAKSEIIVYPNPSTDKLNLQFLNSLENNTQIDLFNSFGKVVYSMMVLNKQIEIDLESSPKGIYFLQVKNSQTQKVFKIVKE